MSDDGLNALLLNAVQAAIAEFRELKPEAEEKARRLHQLRVAILQISNELDVEVPSDVLEGIDKRLALVRRARKRGAA